MHHGLATRDQHPLYLTQGGHAGVPGEVLDHVAHQDAVEAGRAEWEPGRVGLQHQRTPVEMAVGEGDGGGGVVDGDRGGAPAQDLG